MTIIFEQRFAKELRRLRDDKRLINRYQRNLIRVLNPVDFILEDESDDSSDK